MGTDIWMYGEYRRENKWHLIGELEKNIWYYPEEPEYSQPYKPKAIYDGRDYDLFAILADVRNPTGRSLDGQKYECISQPRGLPADVCFEIQEWSKDWTEPESPSWLLLQEVLDFDWDSKFIVHQAMVEAPVAHLFGDGRSKFPREQWPEDIPVSYAAAMSDGVSVTWIDSYRDSVGHHFFEALNALRSNGAPDHNRLVFWFSS